MIKVTVVVFASDWDNPFSNNEMYAVFPGRLITKAQVRGGLLLRKGLVYSIEGTSFQVDLEKTSEPFSFFDRKRLLNLRKMHFNKVL